MNGAFGVAPGGVCGSAVAFVVCGVATALLVGAPVRAQELAAADTAPVSAVPDATIYRALGAKHLYELYRERIYKGQLPPLLYAIAVIEIEIDEDGSVVDAVVTREPASAKDVVPWILGLIKAASPFPKPQQPGRTRYQDVWLVDRTYTFQLHTLSEGQR